MSSLRVRNETFTTSANSTRAEYERMIPPLGNWEGAMPHVTTETETIVAGDQFSLRVTVSNPREFSQYYMALSPEACFVYEVVGGTDEDTFVKVASLGDFEQYPASSNGIAGSKYRTSTYEKLFDDIQELQIAKDQIKKALYDLYQNVVIASNATYSVGTEKQNIPSDINDELDAHLSRYLTLKASILQTKGMLLAYAAEKTVLEGIKVRVLTSIDSLKSITAALQSLGTPSQTVKTLTLFADFESTLNRIDEAYQASHTYVTEASAVVTEANTVINDAISITSELQKDITKQGTSLTTECNKQSGCSGTDFGNQLQSFIDASKAALTTVSTALLSYESDYVARLNEIQAKASSIGSETLFAQYQKDSVLAMTGIQNVQKVLQSVAPTLKVLNDVLYSVEQSRNKIESNLSEVEDTINQLNIDVEQYTKEATDHIQAIRNFVPDFNPENPFYRWNITINVVGGPTNE